MTARRPLHQSWLLDQAAKSAHHIAQAHALNNPSPDVKRAAQKVRETLRAQRLARRPGQCATELK